MPFRLSHIQEYDSFVALDIGAYKVRVLVCQIREGRIVVLAKNSARQSRKDMEGGEIGDIYGVARTVSRAIDRAVIQAGVNPDDIIIAVNSDRQLYDALQTNYVREGFDTPITLSEIDSIVEGVERKSLDRVRAKIESRLPLVSSEMKLVTTSLTGITIDGKNVANPVGMSGRNVKLQIINIFMPLADYSSYRLLAKHLGKNLLSLVPVGICLPKLVERTSRAYEHNIFVDLGASKTTVVVTNHNQVLGLNVLPFGFSLLSEHLERHTDLNVLERENLVVHPETVPDRLKSAFDDFYRLMIEGIVVSIQDVVPRVFAQNVFLSGLPAENAETLARLKAELERAHVVTSPDSVHVRYVPEESFACGNEPEYHVAYGLANVAEEMCMMKKDPIATILRHVIYRYE